MIIFPLHGVHSGLLEQVVHACGRGCAEVQELAKVGESVDVHRHILLVGVMEHVVQGNHLRLLALHPLPVDKVRCVDIKEPTMRASLVLSFLRAEVAARNTIVPPAVALGGQRLRGPTCLANSHLLGLRTLLGHTFSHSHTVVATEVEERHSIIDVAGSVVEVHGTRLLREIDGSHRGCYERALVPMLFPPRCQTLADGGFAGGRLIETLRRLQGACGLTRRGRDEGRHGRGVPGVPG